MIKSAEYLQFEAGFLKEAESQGYDLDFVRGLIKEADDVAEKWAEALEAFEQETGDPNFRTKLAIELCAQADVSQMYKLAEDPAAAKQPNNWGKLWELIQALKLDTPTGGAVGGGIGGGLLGLLLGSLFKSPGLGLMLGGGLGSGLGYGFGSGYFNDAMKNSDFMRNKPGATPANQPQQEKPVELPKVQEPGREASREAWHNSANAGPVPEPSTPYPAASSSTVESTKPTSYNSGQSSLPGTQSSPAPIKAPNLTFNGYKSPL